MNNQETVCAVVVTYNRKDLLLVCLEALKKQSKPLNAIYIIDNASTDGTPVLLLENNYINELPPENLNNSWEKNLKIKNLNNEINVHYVRMHQNTGGAGGFYEGVKRAYEKGYDWLWLMDDDTIATEEALEVLFSKINIVEEDIGFLCSKILWNNDIHQQNVPNITKLTLNGKIPFNKYDYQGVLLVEYATFVSMLIKNNVIKEVGFPIKEFFIWNDDVEYTQRITQRGLLGLYVMDSIIYHKTDENYGGHDIELIDEANIWKRFYGSRNFLYTCKRKSILSFVFYLMEHLIYINFRILKYRKQNKFKLMWVNTKAAFASIFFNPKVIKP